jgi:flavin reductase (DIM6/NTAB) family NADH-FMN oxidoreductase RutF
MSNANRATLVHEGAIDAAVFRSAMRQLVGGISIITVGKGEDRTGLTSTSVSSLSAEPPALVFCLNQSSSSWPVLQRWRAFAVNVLPPTQRPLADRFSGRRGEKGLQRYEGARWSELATGTPVLAEALAVLDCEVEEIVEKFGSGVIIGRVVAAHVKGEEAEPEALTYWRGAYGTLRR